MLATWITGQIVFNGVVQGMVYGLLAMSIVLIYRSTKVINFAVGKMGLFGSGLLVLLDVAVRRAVLDVAAIALVGGVVYGAIIELAVVRRLFTAPRVILLVATIGVSQLSAAILIAFPEIENPRAGYPMPIGGATGTSAICGSSGARRGAGGSAAGRAGPRVVPQPHPSRTHRPGRGGQPRPRSDAWDQPEVDLDHRVGAWRRCRHARDGAARRHQRFVGQPSSSSGRRRCCGRSSPR